MAGPWERYSEVPKTAAAPWLKYQKPAPPDSVETPSPEVGPWQKYAKPAAAPKGDKLPITPPPATFAESIGRGVDILQGNLYAATEAVGEATGIESLTEFGKEGRERNFGQVQDGAPRQTFSDIGSVGDFGQWMKETVGEQIPIMAPSMAGAAAGATVGAIGGPLGATVGGLIGAFVPSLVQGVGETQSAIKEKAPEEVAPGWAFAGGSAIAALDSIVPGKVGSRLVKVFGIGPAEEIAKRALTKPAKDGVVKRTAKGTAEGMATEGFTEALQEAIGEVSASGATDQPIDLGTLTGAMIEAGAAGALMGGVAGGTSSVPSRGAEAAPAPLESGATPAPAPLQSEATAAPPSQEGAQPPSEQLTTPETAVPLVSTAPPTREERAILREAGWTDEQVTEMEAEERAEALAEAWSQGVVAAPDTPTAEPVADLLAQARDLADPQNPRQGVYLPPDAARHTRETGRMKEIITTSGGRALTNFDDNGGVLIVRDAVAADEARAARKAGTPIQEIVGRLTGAGTGKPTDGTQVVQQVDADGAVTRESLVAPEAVAPTVEAFTAPSRDVRVVAPEEALSRREEGIAAETPAALPLPATQKPTPKLREELQAKPAPLEGEIITPADQKQELIDEEVRESLADGYMDATGDQSPLEVAISNVEDLIAQGEINSPNGAPWAEVLKALRARQPAPPALTKPAQNIPENIPAIGQATEKAARTKPQKVTTPRPVNLYKMILDMGGMKDVRGEVARGLGLPGHQRARFIRATGKDPDKIREALAEQGYFPQYGTPEQAVADSTPADLYDLIERFSRGEKVYSPEDAGAGATEAQAKAETERARDRIDAEMVGDDVELAERATAIMRDSGVTPMEAIEQAAIQLESERVSDEDQAKAHDYADIPFPDFAQPERMAPDGERLRPAGEGSRGRSGAREGPEDGGEAGKGRGKAEGPTRRASQGVKPPSTETVKTADGPREQFVLPGAERVSDADLARRKSAERLKPKVAQKPADVGLFGDASAQLDLVDMARQTPDRKARTEAKRPRLTNADKATMKAEIADIVQRIAGRRTMLMFRDQIPVESGTDERYQRDMREAAEAGGYELAETVGGYYESGHNLGDDIIAIALADPTYKPRSTAHHESWHRIEQYLLTAPEHRLLASDLAQGPRSSLRRLAAQRMGMTVRDPLMRDLPDYEITALAFERYMEMAENRATGASGLHIGVRRAFDRIVEIVRQVRALLTGKGVRSVEDLFARAGKGEMGRRADRMEGVDRQTVDQAPKLGKTEVNRDLTQTAAFKAWFKDSAAVDGKGKPLVFYHGSNRSFSAFTPTAGMRRDDYGRPEEVTAPAFFFTTDRAAAQMFARDRVLIDQRLRGKSGGRAQTRAFYLSAQNPLDLTDSLTGYPGGDALGAFEEATGTSPQTWEDVQRTLDDPWAVERLTDEGYDGVILRESDGAKSWAVFDPIQIKSTDNSGAFSPSDPRVKARFGIARPSGGMAGIPYQASSIQRTRAEKVLDRVRKLTDPTRIKIQDRVIALKRIQEEIERETGIRIPESLDVYTAEALYHGKAGERLVDLKVNFVEPLVARMQALKIDAATLDEYLIARHAPERNAEILKIDPRNPAGAGVTDAEAAQTMARLAPKGAELTELAGRVDKLVEQVREGLVRDGLIDRATSDAWKAKYRYYVPLRGHETDEDSEAHARIGRGIDVRGKESQQALGRRSRSDSPLAYLIMQAEQGIIRGEKNRVARTLLRMVQTFTDPDIWQVAKAEVKRRVNPKTGLVESYAVPPAFSKADNLFAVKVGGKTTWVEIKHEGVARALRGASFGDSGGIARAAFKLARGYSMLVTSYSPEFVPTNWARDLQTALINVGDIEAKPAGVRRQILKDALAAKTIRGILAAQRDPNSSKEYAKWFEEFRHAGGKISFLALNDIQEIKADIDSRLKAADRSKANPWELLKAFGRGVDVLNTAVENSVRLSTYIALRKAGIAQSRAAFIARELTVNFNRKGELSTWLNTAYLFFNASAQGTMRIAQGVARSKSVRRAVMGLAVAGATMELMNAFLSPDDEDGEKVYDKIPDWIKERNLILMKPWGDGYFMIPMPYGFNVPYNAGQQMTAVTRGKRKPLEAALTVAASAWDSFNPMGMAASFTQFISPTLLDPFIQSDENLSWFGTPIMPFQPPQSHKPDAETYFRSAPESAKAFAKWLNEMTGGNVGKPGLIDISPETIEHFVEFAGGGLGRFAVNLSQTVEAFIAGDPIELPEVPFVRRFYGTQTSTSAQRARFFEAWNEADAARYEIQQLAKSSDQEAFREARERNASLLRAHGPLKAIRKALDDLDDRRDAINLKDMPREERRKQLDGIEIRERGLLKRAAEVYGEARQ